MKNRKDSMNNNWKNIESPKQRELPICNQCKFKIYDYFGFTSYRCKAHIESNKFNFETGRYDITYKSRLDVNDQGQCTKFEKRTVLDQLKRDRIAILLSSVALIIVVVYCAFN